MGVWPLPVAGFWCIREGCGYLERVTLLGHGPCEECIVLRLQYQSGASNIPDQSVETHIK